jgi:hypothetical protein
MRNGRRTSPFLAGNRIVVMLAALMVAAGLTAATAIARGDGPTVAKKKKPCPAGTHKVIVKKKKDGVTIKKRKCVPNATPNPIPPGQPGGPTAALVISPTASDFGTANHGGFGACTPPPDADCPTRDFVVTNAGGGASGVPAPSITEVHNPEIGGPPAFQVYANSCAAGLAPGGTCTVTVRFAPNSNAGDELFDSVLHVIGSPGGDVQATLHGMGV